MSSQHNSELHSRVDSWAHTVAFAVQSKHSSSQRLLRPRLAPTSSNPRLRKRALVEEEFEDSRTTKKIAKYMADDPTQLHKESARGRGRGRGRGRPRGQGSVRGQPLMRGQNFTGGTDLTEGLGLLQEDQQPSVLIHPEVYTKSTPSTLPS